ncbi:DNA methylase [Coralloluteibacterium stylophorae]|uniref:DNA methylase n=1 Tax=Coralloluteibacterium stylophorae TaxID=1776034 RepID=A0A8J7VS68_9GAMM|nr:DNA methylase [Coralloluteibacterium stylophorae]MBS7458084.1 DNA methylase [Coralloluteibacterium stylophorae]
MAGKISAADLGIHVRKGDEASLFRWFVASFLFGKRIGQKIAAETWHVLVEKHGRDTPQKLCNCSHAELVRILGEGGYVRYDESTANRLSELCRLLIDEYGGSIHGLYEASDGRADFERRLRRFKGVGPVTVRIFMREAKPVLFPAS